MRNSHKKSLLFFLCMYKMVLNITKETWGKYGKKTAKYHNQEKNIIELWHKMSELKQNLGIQILMMLN